MFVIESWIFELECGFYEVLKVFIKVIFLVIQDFFIFLCFL